jgi:glycosyltransferase involved in cell wall biosynthesis
MGVTPLSQPLDLSPLGRGHHWQRYLRARRSVHIVNPFWNATGGSELRALSLYEQLKGECRARLWTDEWPDPSLARRFPITRINTRRLRIPLTGTFVFVGVYKHPRRWVRWTHPRRVILVYNTPDPDLLGDLIRTMSPRTTRPVEVVYASQAMRHAIGYPGVVQPSPIDLRRFTPRVGERGTSADAAFTVGKMSRDSPEKHHQSDPAFYRRLAAASMRVRLMGATQLAAQVGAEPGTGANGVIELLSEGAMEPQSFLQSLDCFFYRTAHHWDEPFGRVVMEAMACGLPVVCESRGGYAEVIEHGVNGFLFDSDDEAYEIIRCLERDDAMRHRIGRAARETIERLYSTRQQREIIAYYTE